MRGVPVVSHGIHDRTIQSLNPIVHSRRVTTKFLSARNLHTVALGQLSLAIPLCVGKNEWRAEWFLRFRLWVISESLKNRFSVRFSHKHFLNVLSIHKNQNPVSVMVLVLVSLIAVFLISSLKNTDQWQTGRCKQQNSEFTCGMIRCLEIEYADVHKTLSCLLHYGK